MAYGVEDLPVRAEMASARSRGSTDITLGIVVVQ